MPNTLNPYPYVLNNPLRFVDPLGLSPAGTGPFRETIENYGTQSVGINNQKGGWQYSGPGSTGFRELENRSKGNQYAPAVTAGNAVAVLAAADNRSIGQWVAAELKSAGKQVVLGEFSDEVTTLGIIGQVVVDFTPIGLAADIRDSIADFKEWQESGGSILKPMASSAIRFIPVVGTLKTVGKGAKVVKGTGNAGKWVDEAGNIKWPPNDGFAGTPKNITLKPGTQIDRYGYESGSFASPVGTPYNQRSLAPGTENKPYHVYEVVKPIEAQGGKIAPWFDQPGGGTQYKFNMSIEDLIKGGYIREVKK